MSADITWQVISEFGAAGQYLARVIACTVEGTRIGALRRLTNADGGMVVERLDALDGDTCQLNSSGRRPSSPMGSRVARLRRY